MIDYDAIPTQICLGQLRMNFPVKMKCLFAVGLSLLFTSVSVAQRAIDSPITQLETIRKMLQTPENEIDLAKVKLTIDKMIDPKIDETATLARIEEITRNVRAMYPADSSNRYKFEALRSYLYQPGPWNQYQIFKYDLEGDPLGTSITGKLLANYIATRRGNCVSMPILFVIVGQRLGLDVTLSRAPEHYFVKFRSDDGTYINAETTHDGGVKLDASYAREYVITSQAVKNGVYLRPLTKRESATQIVGTLTEFLSHKGDYKHLHPLLDLLMQNDKREASFMVRKGYAYYLEAKARFIDKYPDPNNIPENLKAESDRLGYMNRTWYEKAEALGWRETTPQRLKEQEEYARNAAREQKLKGTP
jgi:regulator of sirC expression with transglutaminase-like and TPR domain